MSEGNHGGGSWESLIAFFVFLNFCYDSSQADEKDIKAIERRVELLETQNARVLSAVGKLKETQTAKE